jgi:hypothetical protein
MVFESFEGRLDRLDLSLFSSIPTQSSDDDRKSWLAVQRAIRRGGYTYLEIGSYLGGSLQQHYVDPLCNGIISIDNRPAIAPDERDYTISYHGNSTEDMLVNLRGINEALVCKVITFETDASTIDISKIPAAPSFCFIDGEHTKTAVANDFEFCLRVCDRDAAICLHDSRIIYRGIVEILASLNRRQIVHNALRLPGDTFAIFLNDCPAFSDPYIRTHSSHSARFLRRMQLRHLLKSSTPKWMHRTARAVFPPP